MKLLMACRVQALAVLLLLGVSACSTYHEQSSEARRLYYEGMYAEAEQRWLALREGNDAWAPLVDLEVGMVRFATGDHEGSSRALEEADQMLEVLDFSSDASEVGKYVFSESMEMFRARPYEKIFLSAVNLLNYAARGELEAARTEANLLYSKADGIERLEDSTRYDSAFIYVLVGLLDEMTEPDRPGQALISYERALKSISSPTLEATADRLRALRDGASGSIEPGSELGPDEGVLVTFVLNGRGPVLREFDQYQLTPEEQVYFRDIVQAEVLTRVAATAASGVSAGEVNAFVASNLFYPKLKLAVMRRRASKYQTATLDVSGEGSQAFEQVLDLQQQILQWFDSVRGKILAAAVSRAAFRVSAGLATQLSVQHAMKNQKRKADRQLGSMLGAFAGMLVQRGLYEMDTPDTRCWTLLPTNVLFQRRKLKEGDYDLSCTLSGSAGAQKRLSPKKVTIEPGKFTFAVWLCHD